MSNEETGQASAVIKLTDGAILRALPDKLVREGRSLGSAEEREIYYRHIAGISVTRRNGLAAGLLVGLLFLVVAGYVYTQLPELRTWAYGSLVAAILAPIIGALIRTQNYQLYSAGWPGGKWEISAGADKDGKLLGAIREGCAQVS